MKIWIVIEAHFFIIFFLSLSSFDCSFISIVWAPSTLPNLQKIRKDCCWYCLLGSSSTRAEGFDLESRLIYLIYRYSIGLSTTGRFLSQISLSGRNSIVWWRNNPRGERIDLTLLAIVWLIYFIFLFCFVLFCFVLFFVCFFMFFVF